MRVELSHFEPELLPQGTVRGLPPDLVMRLFDLAEDCREELRLRLEHIRSLGRHYPERSLFVTYLQWVSMPANRAGTFKQFISLRIN